MNARAPSSLAERLSSRVALSVDRLVARGITGRGKSARSRSRTESLGHAERLDALGKIAELYDAAEPLQDLAHFFGAPAPLEHTVLSLGTRRVGHDSVDATDIRWRSDRPPFATELSARFFEHDSNLQAHARLFLGREPHRPVAILVHGYRGGNLAFEQRVWPIEWLLRHGVDVALYVLPLHGKRAPAKRSPQFPASDPRLTIEGFRQAIFELSSLVAHFRDRGAPHVGALGMSLGGYTVSLLGTTTPIDFLAPVIPLASFADVALEAGRLVGSEEEQRLQHAALERAYRVVSPFSRPSLLRPETTLVMGGESDAITPIQHAERLASHFEADLVRFSGGHLLQFGRREGFRAFGRKLRAHGIFRR